MPFFLRKHIFNLSITRNTQIFKFPDGCLHSSHGRIICVEFPIIRSVSGNIQKFFFLADTICMCRRNQCYDTLERVWLAKVGASQICTWVRSELFTRRTCTNKTWRNVACTFACFKNPSVTNVSSKVFQNFWKTNTTFFNTYDTWIHVLILLWHFLSVFLHTSCFQLGFNI